MRVFTPPARKLEGFEADIETKKTPAHKARVLFCERAYKRTEIKVRRYKRNVLSVRQTGIYTKYSNSFSSIKAIGSLFFT